MDYQDSSIAGVDAKSLGGIVSTQARRQSLPFRDRCVVVGRCLDDEIGVGGPLAEEHVLWYRKQPSDDVIPGMEAAWCSASQRCLESALMSGEELRPGV